MKIGKEYKYPTDGESGAHGYTYETEVTVTRDEILEALTDAILSDDIDTNYTLHFDDEYEIEIQVCEIADEQDIKDVYQMLSENFIDDDYDTQVVYDKVYEQLDSSLPKKLDYTVDVIRMT